MESGSAVFLAGYWGKSECERGSRNYLSKKPGMFLELDHQKLQLFKTTKLLVTECYRLTRLFPTDEKFAMSQQIGRAALSVHLNIAEAASRRSSPERRRYHEIARGSLIELDAAFEIALALNYLEKTTMQAMGSYLIDSFKMLSGLIRNSAP
jgi:four helix bundle protein